ncbi:6-hydroxy-D-nicotine oxidase [Cytospora mali]|uniref:6-hydroxy-D-nicotine oxidase n=1 Tax=Cytospora mali TaxID=578113 RepID=A0A194UX22_CYTMA|nr:6-hydroxy-D-nicotine oxidase [Valsa mali var. pyri (nom. inval.)]
MSAIIPSDHDLPILYRDSTPRDKFLESVWGHVFNQRQAKETRVPRAVIHATSTSHVAAAVKLANELGCRLSGSGGDKGIEYDEKTGILSCPSSATGRMVNGFLAGKGRMFAGGHCPDVGLGGFLLQGGMGWNCKNWGWACESIVEFDAVTADGRSVHASEGENADLLWAARGAGPGFPAIITRFYLKTRPLHEMYQSLYIYPISEYRKVLQWVIDVCETADTDTEIVAVGQYVPEHPDPVILANFLTFKPDRAQGEAALRPFHDDPNRPANPLIEFFAKPTSLPDQYAPQAASNPEGHRYCSENAYIRNEEDVPAVLEEAFTTLPNRKSFALYFGMAPTSRREHYITDLVRENDGYTHAGSAMALSMHTDHYFALYTVWEEPEGDERFTSWTHGVMSRVERFSAGSYLGDADFQHRRTKFWRDGNAKRLMEIRRRWDPEGRICGYLDEGDKSGVEGLKNEFEWE